MCEPWVKTIASSTRPLIAERASPRVRVFIASSTAVSRIAYIWQPRCKHRAEQWHSSALAAACAQFGWRWHTPISSETVCVLAPTTIKIIPTPATKRRALSIGEPTRGGCEPPTSLMRMKSEVRWR
jgi:hypothetical protein